jgi:hypothetical protein
MTLCTNRRQSQASGQRESSVSVAKHSDVNWMTLPRVLCLGGALLLGLHCVSVAAWDTFQAGFFIVLTVPRDQKFRQQQQKKKEEV